MPSARASATPTSCSASARPDRVATSEGTPEARSGATTSGPGPMETNVSARRGAAGRTRGRRASGPDRRHPRRSRRPDRPPRGRPARRRRPPRPPGPRAAGSPSRGGHSRDARRRRRQRSGAGGPELAGCPRGLLDHLVLVDLTRLRRRGQPAARARESERRWIARMPFGTSRPASCSRSASSRPIGTSTRSRS